MFFYVKRFCPIIRAANNNQEKFTILHVPHIRFHNHNPGKHNLSVIFFLAIATEFFSPLCEGGPRDPLVGTCQKLAVKCFTLSSQDTRDE